MPSAYLMKTGVWHKRLYISNHPAPRPAAANVPSAPHRRNLHDVFRIEIDQLEPILRDIGRRENVVLVELGDERLLQIAFADSR